MYQINRNFSWCNDYSEQSFVGLFHEENRWDDEEYFKLENELYQQCEKYAKLDAIPRDIAFPVMRIFSFLALSLSCQFDKNDTFKLDISREQYYQRRERIQLIFEGFFKGEMPNKEHLEY